MPRTFRTGRTYPPRRRFRLATARFRLLPSFLIIGAQRAGTTSLMEYLRTHPDVAGPSPAGRFVHHAERRSWKGGWLRKELHFFDARFGLGLDWYRSFFPTSASQRLARWRGGDLVAGEATPYYLFHPAVPQRVAATLPDVRLIVLLRDPVERAYSHYHLMRRKRLEKRSFEEAVEAEEGLAGEEERLLVDPDFPSRHHRHHSYLSRGLYAEQLERWFLHFSRDHMLVLRAEDLYARPAEVYPDVLAFLGLRPQPLKRIVHRNRAKYPPLDPAIRAKLEERFAESNARLADVLGREFSWGSKAPPAEAVSLRPER